MKNWMVTGISKVMLCTVLLGTGYSVSEANAVSNVQVIAVNSVSGFKDVKGDHWAKSSIQAAVSKGYFKGYSDGTFKPNATVTRAEFATLVARVSSNPMTDVKGSFKDLVGHWSEQEVNTSIGKGFITVGDYSSEFKPGTPIQRREMAKWLASGLAAKDTDFKQALTDTKDTIIPVVEYYKGGLNKADYPYVSVALGTGLLGGYPDGTFGANKLTTRAEAAVIIQRFESAQVKSADSFRGLNELREVGTTGTNLTTVTPYEYTGNRKLKDILGKNVMLRTGAGKVQLHHFIVMNVKSHSDINSIYGPMFIDNTTRLPFVNNRYRVYIDVSVIPISKDFKREHFINGAISGLETGFRIDGNVTETYGYKSLPLTGGENFFAQGKETRLWAQTSIDNKVNSSGSSIYGIVTKDNMEAAIILMEENMK